MISQIAIGPRRALDGIERVLSRWLERSDAGFLAVVVLVALGLTSLPFLFVVLAVPKGWHFAGFMLDVPDHAQYFSWARDFMSSNLAADRLTSEPNQPAFFNLLWWVVGRVELVTGWSYADLYSILRVAGVISLLGSTMWFLRSVVRSRSERQLALVLFAFGSGLGVVWVVLKYVLHYAQAPHPFDLFTAEPNSFLLMIGYPHFAIALSLMISTFALFLLGLRRRELRFAILAGVVALILGLQHTYDLVTIYSVLGAFGLAVWIRDRRFPRDISVSGALIAGISAPPALYSVLLVRWNPIWGAVLSQFDNANAFTPNLLHLPILMGVPLALAIVGFRFGMLTARRDEEVFIAVWFLVHFPLIYLPVNFQIHLLLGWQVPISILAARALVRYVGPWVSRWRPSLVRMVPAGLVLLSILTNVYLISWRCIDISRHQAPYFLTSDEVMSLTWMGQNLTAHDVVLTDLNLGQFVPVWSDARTFLGHWADTLDFQQKQTTVQVVMSPETTDRVRSQILTSYSVNYVVAEGEQRASLSQNTGASSDLVPVEKFGQVTIFKVVSH